MKTTLLQKIERRLQPARERLLIVDDEAPILQMVSSFFKQRGYRVKTAVNLEEAEARLAEEPFDLVLQDVVLPDGDGIDFLPRMRALQPGIPAVVMTGLGYEDSAMRDAKKHSATSYVSKFLPLDQLLMEVHRALKASKKADADKQEQAGSSMGETDEKSEATPPVAN